MLQAMGSQSQTWLSDWTTNYPKTEGIRPTGRETHFGLLVIPNRATSLNTTPDKSWLHTHLPAPLEKTLNFSVKAGHSQSSYSMGWVKQDPYPGSLQGSQWFYRDHRVEMLQSGGAGASHTSETTSPVSIKALLYLRLSVSCIRFVNQGRK